MIVGSGKFVVRAGKRELLAILAFDEDMKLLVLSDGNPFPKSLN